VLAIVGTIPDQDFPLVAGEVTLEGDMICIEGNRAPVNRGTPALLAAALMAGKVLDQVTFFAYVVGDIGLGDGSRRLYKYLTQDLPRRDFIYLCIIITTSKLAIALYNNVKQNIQF
jgi:hypothetical protein